MLLIVMSFAMQSAMAAGTKCDLESVEERQMCLGLQEFDEVLVRGRRGQDASESLEKFIATVELAPALVGHVVNGMNIALLDRFDGCEEPGLANTLARLNKSIILKNEYGPEFKFTCNPSRVQEGFAAPISVWD